MPEAKRVVSHSRPGEAPQRLLEKAIRAENISDTHRL